MVIDIDGKLAVIEFNTGQSEHGCVLSIRKLLTPTQDIIAAATTALERIRNDGHQYAKAGVMLNDFTGSGVS